MLSVSRFTLNTRDEEAQLSFSVKQGDTARRIIATLTENGEMFCLPDDCYAVFAANKSDGTKFNDSCVIQDGRIIYDLDPQLTLAVGRADCDITVYSRGGAVISTARFTMTVFESIFAGASDDMVSEDTFHVLNNLIGDANDTINDMEELNDAVTAAEAEREAAEAEREAAEAAREAAEQERVDVNTGIVAEATRQASNAANSAVLAVSKATAADNSAKTAESWAVGGTGTRADEDTNNAKYWSDRAETIAGGDYAPRVHKHIVADITNFPNEMPPSSHHHNASDISSGVLSEARLPIITITKGGTGATSASGALHNLGINVTASEINCLDGTNSNIQGQIDNVLRAIGTTSGTSNQFILSKPNFILEDGAAIRFKLHIDSGAAPTLNVNDTGAKKIMTLSGEEISTGIKAGTWLTVVYSQALDFFVLQGSGDSRLNRSCFGNGIGQISVYESILVPMDTNYDRSTWI